MGRRPREDPSGSSTLAGYSTVSACKDVVTAEGGWSLGLVTYSTCL